MKAFWEERYGEDDYAYGTEPNDFFAQFITDLPPGRLLLPAEGEGRNAVYAARRGWEVTAFDYSRNARLKAEALAGNAGVSIHYEEASLHDFPFPQGTFNLVGLFFAHMVVEDRRYLHQMVASSLRTGGTVILEAFSKKQLGLASGGPRNEGMLYDAGLLREDFHGLDISLLKEENITLREGRFHQGEAWVVRLIAHKTQEIPSH